MSFIDNLKKGWNAFLGRDPTMSNSYLGSAYSYGSYKPDRWIWNPGSERTIVTAIYNRIAMDTAQIKIRHVQLDKEGRFEKEKDSDLNNCLSLEANCDQTGRQFIQDVVMSMLEEGVVAIVPVDASEDIRETSSFDVRSMRVGRIVNWYPRHVRLEVYDDRPVQGGGRRKEIVLPKASVCIIENPLYAVVNDKNSIAQRLIQKLALLDVVDQETSSGKLNMIIQLPYIIKTEARRKQALQRRKDISDQLSDSKYGIAYTDGTERITQLNRPLENTLMSQIEYLTKMLYSQLGITEEIMNGTADEKVMLNYYNRTIEPMVAAIADEMKRKFLTKTARSQNQSIEFFRDPFKLVPVADLAELADKFTRNEIMTSNEIRQVVGMQPSNDPSADELRNKNLSESKESIASKQPNPIVAKGQERVQQILSKGGKSQNG